MLGSLIRGWREKTEYVRQDGLIRGGIRVGPAGFHVIPWNIDAWRRLAGRDLNKVDLLTLAPKGCDAKRVLWESVEQIWTYKTDFWAYDEICLAFFTHEESVVEVGECMHGWAELWVAMEDRFPEIPADWFCKVMLPAFATNATLLWPR